MVLDFTEIPQAHGNSDNRDAFELFACEFLEILGLTVESGVDRGPDDGKDLLVIEELQGALGSQQRRWLVSCKHKAHSGNAVGVEHETNIRDRMEHHNAQGFIAIYSTVPSSALGRRFEQLRSNFPIKIYDRGEIEKILMTGGDVHHFVQRYMPNSFAEWESRRRTPSNALGEYIPLKCHVTDVDVLRSKKYMGIIVYASRGQDDPDHPGRIERVFPVMKGAPDRALERRLFSNGLYTSWEDVSDLMIPTKFMRWVMAVMNGLRSDREKYSDQAFEDLKDIMLRIAQYVFRNITDQEKERYLNLKDLEDALGG